MVVYNGVIREKPRDADEARAFIRSYADAPATTVGACVCACLDTGVQYETVEENKAHIGRLPDETVEQLIAEGDVFKCAGGGVPHMQHCNCLPPFAMLPVRASSSRPQPAS